MSDMSTLSSDMSSDLFYLQWGIEHCNMRKRASDCAFILMLNYGKSNKFSKLLFRLHEMYTSLSHLLDNVVCTHYPLMQNTIDVPPPFEPKYKNTTHEPMQCRNIIGVFYRSETLDPYPLRKYNAGGHYKHCHYVSPRDMQYIRDFVLRHEEYLDTLSSYSLKDYLSKFKSELNAHITKMKSKVSVLHDYLVSEIREERNYVLPL